MLLIKIKQSVVINGGLGTLAVRKQLKKKQKKKKTLQETLNIEPKFVKGNTGVTELCNRAS